MSLWKKLFGGGEASQPAAAQVTEYKGYRITPQPISEDGGYRISAVIEGDVGGEVKSHTLIRADVIRDLQEAETASVAKAQVMIDQMGDRVFS